MDRELRRKIVALINAATAVIYADDDIVSVEYHNSLIRELHMTRNLLQDEMNNPIHDSYI